MRDTDISKLHPVLRTKAVEVVQRLNEQGIPFKIFEAFRTPRRQAQLYAQGRNGAPGRIVTKARPWHSYHQYGVAADFVLNIDGEWSWDTRGEKAGWWKKLHEVAKEQGLEPVSFELPHLQLASVTVSQLLVGQYPPDGDESWSDNLAEAIESWRNVPRSPPLPPLVGPQRPALVGLDEGVPAHSNQEEHIVVARPSLRMRGGPGTNFDVIRNLPTNQRVFAMGYSGEWTKVDLEGDGQVDGYCHSGFLQPT